MLAGAVTYNLKAGTFRFYFSENMQENLVIVESPAKAKTIEKILGDKYTVKSSYGHIRDLKKKGLSIDIAKDSNRSTRFRPTR